MLFSSMIFLWIFLPIVIVLYFIIPKKIKNYFLLLASLIFYGWGGTKYLIVLFYIILVNYLSGILINKIKKKKTKKIVITIAIALNLIPLFFFKYYGTLSTHANKLLSLVGLNSLLPVLNLVLPLGISFFTFQALSYVIDLYRGEIKVQKNPFKLALYITFFPQLIAGPIVKYREVEKEMDERKITINDFSYGIKRFIFGLSKKVLIANYVASIADHIFNNFKYAELSTPLVWFAVLLYSIQIYYDFSGYSDMAIGLGRMFGFHFLENFNYPYISKSIKEFWRRWHISLSTWFKEYVYIPLGGNRKGKYRTLINLSIVFLLTGIWHGASLNFWLWGVWHGFFILIERLFLGKWLENNKYKVINYLYVGFVVVIGWAVFSCDSLKESLSLLKYMFTWNGNAIFHISYFMNIKVVLMIVLAVLFCGPIQTKFPKLKKKLYSEGETTVLDITILLALLALCIINLVSGTYNPFIYFRF